MVNIQYVSENDVKHELRAASYKLKAVSNTVPYK